jgi:hypothetical protein
LLDDQLISDLVKNITSYPDPCRLGLSITLESLDAHLSLGGVGC